MREYRITKDIARKYYDILERYIPKESLKADDPISDDVEHVEWRVKRRVGAVGM